MAKIGPKPAPTPVSELLGKLTNAGTALLSAPIVAGEGDVALVSAWTMGDLSEHQVRLSLPLLWPWQWRWRARSF
jgi:hypothetical protein